MDAPDHPGSEPRAGAGHNTIVVAKTCARLASAGECDLACSQSAARERLVDTHSAIAARSEAAAIARMALDIRARFDLSGFVLPGVQRKRFGSEGWLALCAGIGRREPDRIDAAEKTYLDPACRWHPP